MSFTAIPVVLSVLWTAVGANAAMPKQAKMWAAIVVNRPIFHASSIDGDTRVALVMTFAVMNDGDKTIDPEIKKTQLIVNGEAMKEWPDIVANGIRDARFSALPPGEYLFFSYALGDRFKQSGTYRVTLRGKMFTSSEITFRVVVDR